MLLRRIRVIGINDLDWETTMKFKTPVYASVALMLITGIVISRELGTLQTDASQSKARIIRRYELPKEITTIEGKMRYRAQQADRSEQFSKTQLIQRNRIKQALATGQEPQLRVGKSMPGSTFSVPGEGEIFEVFHAPFDSAEQLAEWTMVDLDGNGNDFHIVDYRIYYENPAYWILNTMNAPTPGANGFFNENAAWGHPDAITAGPKDYAAEIWVGFPETDSLGTNYKVADITLDLWIENTDPGDELTFEIAESPKWHLANEEWAMTSAQYSAVGYGSEWREDLRTPFIDLSSATGSVTLSFDHTYSTENGTPSAGNPHWDGGTLFAREHADSAWTVLMPATNGYDAATDGLYAWFNHGLTDGYFDSGIPGYAGHVTSATTVTVDLTGYIGGDVQVRWAFASDTFYDAQQSGATDTEGWWVDNIDISDGGGSLFSNDGSAVGGMITLRLGFEEAGPWEVLGSWAESGGSSELVNFSITENIIGAPGDSLGLRLHAVFDGDDDGETAGWGFEISDVLVMTYTRFSKDAATTFVDLVTGTDSVLTSTGYALVGTTYDPVATIANLGLTDIGIYDAFLEIENAFGDLDYIEHIYTYGPGDLGDTLVVYPGAQDFSNAGGYYDFPDWTPTSEGDYVLRAYVKFLKDDDEPLDDMIEIPFHVYGTAPVLSENMNAPKTIDTLFAGGWSYEAAYGDTSAFIGDLFGEGDTEIWWFSAAMGVRAVREAVITPVLDLSLGTNHALRYEQHLFAGGEEAEAWRMNIKATTDGGTTWKLIRTANGASAFAARHGIYDLDISDFADGENDFQLAFEVIYEGDMAALDPYGYLTIDDVSIYANADLTAPATPVGVAVTAGDLSATVSWTGGDADVMYYSVYFSEFDDGSNTQWVSDVSGSKTSFKVTGLDNGLNYYIHVSATDRKGNESDGSVPLNIIPVDVTAPTAIIDLFAEMISDTLHLTWSAPYESGVDGRTTYDIRYSLAPITAATFDTNQAVHDTLTPYVSESETEADVLIPMAAPAVGGQIYVAIKTTDENGLISDTSNVANTDHTAPAQVTDLAVAYNATTEIFTLTWTAPGDDDTLGTVASYDLRVAYTEQVPFDFEKATVIDVVIPATVPGGTITVDLDPASDPVFPDFKMAFALIAIDDVGNKSERSYIAAYGFEWLAVEENRELPVTYSLRQNYPNPFNPETTIEFTLPEQAKVVLTIYNMLGQEVNRLAEGEFNAGYHQVTWDATDSNYRQVPSGVYIYRVQAGSYVKTMKMVLLK